MLIKKTHWWCDHIFTHCTRVLIMIHHGTGYKSVVFFDIFHTSFKQIVIILITSYICFQNQPLTSYGRPKGDGEVRMISSVDKRKKDRLYYVTVLGKKQGLQKLSEVDMYTGISQVLVLLSIYMSILRILCNHSNQQSKSAKIKCWTNLFTGFSSCVSLYSLE